MYPNVRNAPGGRMNIRILVVSGNRVIPNTLPAPRISRALPKIVKPRVKPKPQPRPSKRLAIGEFLAAKLSALPKMIQLTTINVDTQSLVDAVRSIGAHQHLQDGYEGCNHDDENRDANHIRGNLLDT